MPMKLASNFAPDPEEEKIDRIITLLTQIKEAVAPTMGKRILRTLGNFAWKVAVLLLMTIISFYLWTLVSDQFGGLLGGMTGGGTGGASGEQEGMSIESTIKALEQIQKIKDAGK